jgi:hypothetical protein
MRLRRHLGRSTSGFMVISGAHDCARAAIAILRLGPTEVKRGVRVGGDGCGRRVGGERARHRGDHTRDGLGP